MSNIDTSQRICGQVGAVPGQAVAVGGALVTNPGEMHELMVDLGELIGVGKIPWAIRIVIDRVTADEGVLNTVFLKQPKELLQSLVKKASEISVRVTDTRKGCFQRTDARELVPNLNSSGIARVS